MHYDAIVARDGKHFNITFPDCVGCNTFAESEQEIQTAAREALEGWLEANLVDRRVPPRPTRHRSTVTTLILPVRIGARLSAALLVRWARQERRLTQGGLAELVGVSQQSIAKLEDPDANPTLETLDKVVTALGLELEVDFKIVAKAGRASASARTVPGHIGRAVKEEIRRAAKATKVDPSATVLKKYAVRKAPKRQEPAKRDERPTHRSRNRVPALSD